MARRIPFVFSIVCALRTRHEIILVYARVSRLVECYDAQLLVCVFLDDAYRVVMGVERGHEDERHVDLVLLIQELDLTDSEIEERHVVLDLQSALRASHT